VGEPIVVRTWVSDMQRASSVRDFEIVRATDDVLLALARTNWAFVRFAGHRITRIPAEIADAFVVVGASTPSVSDS
jgi:acyl-CoA thioesterase FadM